MPLQELIAKLSNQLIDSFRPLIPADRPVALVDFPDSANCGDHAIWLGEKKLLKTLGITPVYQCSANNYDRTALAAKLGNGTILLHGGGNFGDRYTLYHEFRLDILKHFPNNKVIVFPQQVTFLDNLYLERTVAIVAKHSDVTLFGRGLVAEHLLRRYFSAHARIESGPDMAFLLGPIRRVREPVYDIVWLARTDQERASDQTEAAARLASQAAEKMILPRFDDGIDLSVVVKHRPPTVLLTDWYSIVFESPEARTALRALEYDKYSEVWLRRAIYILSLGRVVITDRLHGHIFCILMGIPHVFLNNDSGKNWNFYESWTREAGLCRIARNASEAWALARNAVPFVRDLDPAQAAEFNWNGISANGIGGKHASGGPGIVW